MTNPSQKRAVKKYRDHLAQRGLARFEVLGRESDRELLRSLAKRLVADGPEAAKIRSAVIQTMADQPPRKGTILAALRNSPLVGAELNLERERVTGRSIDL